MVAHRWCDGMGVMVTWLRMGGVMAWVAWLHTGGVMAW